VSADNGVYILETLVDVSGSIREYRVTEMGAVDNVYYDEDDECDTQDQDVWIKNARQMWGHCKVFKTQEEALDEAFRIAKEIEDEGDFTEYGICTISLARVF
jgi:hypothetical protein